MNPKGQVPVLKHGDKVVVESDEIIAYIDQALGTPGELALVLSRTHAQAFAHTRTHTHAHTQHTHTHTHTHVVPVIGTFSCSTHRRLYLAASRTAFSGGCLDPWGRWL